MGLLEKFASVEVKSDERITPEDKSICENIQSAYEKAQTFLNAFYNSFSGALTEQRDLLSGIVSYSPETTFFSGTRSSMSLSEVYDILEENHRIMIHQILSHFNNKYSVCIDPDPIMDALLPKQPDRRRYDEEEWKAYHNTVCQLTISYTSVLDHIFVQLGGLSFSERAIRELKNKLYSATHHYWNKNESFELKNNVIKLDYGCSVRDWGSDPWELTDSTKEILWGIVHFECGSFKNIPYSMSELFQYSMAHNDFTFPDMEKLKAVKLFKNRRVDLKFADAVVAKQFADEYLRQHYEME